MDGRLREATTAEISLALGKLTRALPPRKAKPEELEESYLIACHKVTNYALQTVVIKLIRGELDGLSKSFAPSPAELSSAIRSEMAFVQRQIELAQERQQIEDHRPLAVPPRLLEDRVREARHRMQDEERALLFTVNSHAEWLSRRKGVPNGGLYSGILSAVYGAPGSLRQSQNFEKSSEGVAW